ncbi:MAG: YbaK/EbsC family protein [Thaumarchaeota archaeon]|nr:YbaK/EbsC family protein [Nitrososphaerota archaeon]
MPGSKELVADFLSKAGIPVEVREFSGSTKNSALAAQELGCGVEQIAKSIVFKGSRTFVVVLSGDRKVDAAKLENLVKGPVKAATPDEVRENTGFPVGGVPPFPHRDGVEVIPDLSLARFADVWAAAGTPNAVFRVRTEDLFRMLGREPAELSVPQQI